MRLTWLANAVTNRMLVAMLTGAFLGGNAGVLDASDAFPRDVVVSTLIDATADEDADARRKAIAALAILRAERAIPALIAALKDPVAKVRAEAACALGTLGATIARGALTHSLRDPDHLVRAAAATALSDLSAPGRVRSPRTSVRGNGSGPRPALRGSRHLSIQ
jgi:hypothetical protein